MNIWLLNEFYQYKTLRAKEPSDASSRLDTFCIGMAVGRKLPLVPACSKIIAGGHILDDQAFGVRRAVVELIWAATFGSAEPLSLGALAETSGLTLTYSEIALPLSTLKLVTKKVEYTRFYCGFVRGVISGFMHTLDVACDVQFHTLPKGATLSVTFFRDE